MRAPLVVAAVAVAAGILVGMERPVPTWGGPLSLWACGGAAAAGALVQRRAPPPIWMLWLLLLAAGLLLGAAARAVDERACTRWLPEGQELQLLGGVESVAAARVRLRVDSVGPPGQRLPCGAVLPGRWPRGAPAPGTTIVASARWWRYPGPGSAGPGGVLLLDALQRADAASGVGAAAAAGPRSRLGPRLRHGAAVRLERAYGDRAPLAASLLLARRDGLDAEVRDRFARAGLSHLLAISGLHVGLVAGVLLLLAGAARLPRATASAAAAAGTVAYVAFLGAPASAARAALQVVLVLAGRTLQRPARPEAMLAAAALVLLAADPASLRAPGFQLSFAGVAGLIALRPPILRRLARLYAWRPCGAEAGKWLADSLAASVAATLATAPIAAWHFGRLAPIGVLANLAAIPLMGALVPTLGLSLVGASVWPPLGRFIGGAGGLMLDALDGVAALAAVVPGGSVAVRPGTAVGTTLALLAGHALTRRAGQVRASLRRLTAVVAAAAIVLVSPIRAATDHVEIHVIDVGQGDAVAIRSPAGRWLLVDAGLAGQGYDAGARVVVPYLQRRGVRRLEALILTHPHLDHIGGAAAVMRSLRPRWVGDPGLPAGNAHYHQLLLEADRVGHGWIAVRDGMELSIDGMSVEFLHPAGAVSDLDANDVSVVLRIEYSEFSALLTGDAPVPVEGWLVDRYGAALEAEVLKVGHHGSITSTSPALLSATGAVIGLVSAGRSNRYGHPHPAILRRLETHGVRVYRTDVQGSIVVRGDARGRINIRTERDHE